MNDLGRRIGNRNRKSSSKSSSGENATQNKPQESKPTRNELVLLGNPAKTFDWEDLKRAKWEVLGEGTVGTTYKVDLEDGTTTVVVKRIKDVVLSAEDFRDKVGALGAMDHGNLLPPRGYCYSKDEKLLVYDYMPMGSLSNQLHGYRESGGIHLSWEVRLSIALGAARAIEHLHAQRHPNNHHGNIKSSNVLLTPSYEARVSDYGLASLTRSALTGGADPRMADVHGFGVLLLELLTGKLPSELPLEEEVVVDLPAWVHSAAREEWTVEVFDVEPMRSDHFEEGMIELLEVAIRCVSPNPTERPWMSDVREKIKDVLRKVRNDLVLLGKPKKRFHLGDISRASEELLGKGMIGRTYKVDLEDGTTTVVVKRIKDVVLSAEDFRDKVVALGAMDHENLLPPRGYFYRSFYGGEKLLVYDYMPMGSLSNQLHGYRKSGGTHLSWEVRLSIALGAAQAIEHLHAQRPPHNHHGNIKSSNVLLMPSYEARVSDYGLASLTRSTRVGWADPRMADVYAFGVLLLELLTGKLPIPAWVHSVAREEWTAEVFDVELMRYHDVKEGMVELWEVAISCVSPNPNERPQMSVVRRKIEELCSPGGQGDGDSQLDQFSQVNNDMSTRKPPDGILEVSERVYVFEYCLTTDWSFFGQITTDWLKDDEYEFHVRGIVAELQDQFPAASFMVLNFGEQENQSQMAKVLSEYDINVMELPQNYGGCPIPRVEIIYYFLRSADEWLSSDTKKNVLLMHCKRGAWPVLAFMLASLSLHRKRQDGEQETLDMIYKKAPCELLLLTSTLNPLPSQLRYLRYVSTWKAGSDWPPPDKPLEIKSVKLCSVPQLDAEGGWRPIVKIIGRDTFMAADQTAKVLFSTPRRNGYVGHYKQEDGDTVTLDVHCNVQGDVVLEYMSLDADLQHGESMFRAMFNTAFISDSVLKLEFEGMDVLWDRQDQYPKEFMAEIVFSQVNVATSLAMADFASDEEEKENRIQKSMTKIPPEALSPKGRAVHSITLSYDANTSADGNEVPELPVQSNIKSTLTLPPMPPSLSESSVHSALEGTFGSFDSTTKSPYTSPSFELDQQYGTTVEGNGDNTESVRGQEIAAVRETNMEVTSLSDSASSLAVNNGSVEATASSVSSSAQFPDMILPKQEILYQQNGSPSSASMSSGYDYDVFLSFRGPDTRSGITDFLYTSLSAAGIHTFKDDEELRVGEEFGPELLKAISQSKVAIPILSKGYASSKWCLNELVQMVECSITRRQKVMPIFYDVSPAEVRHQIGSYEVAFLLHKKKFGGNFSKWKAALTHIANLNGWDNSKKNRGEGELVSEIVREVIDELKMAYLLVTDCLVGVENHVKEINTLMCGHPEDIRILGIHGMGGVGKTTLAKIIYNRLSHHFEACCFLSNIRGTSELKGIEGLQNQLISDVLKKQWTNISNVEEGIKIIKKRLCGKKVLVLLDDVDQMTHWDALIGKPAWFGLGSRIILTSRNRDIVDVPEVSHPYELMSMNFNQSLQLFCKHAFGRDYPSDDYVAFSTEVVKTTGGLPLALEAIGKLLPRRRKDVWDVILKKLKQVPLNEVKRKLKISYDALDDWQKHIFLDIACLFTGFDKMIVLHSWKGSNLFPEEGLEVLQKMSLIKISEDNKLWMHDQLRCLGRDIVGRECDEERKEQTQLWNHEEGFDMVMEKGAKKFEALCRKFDPHLLYHFANEEVERLSSFRYPEVRVFQEHWPSNDFPANLQINMLMLRWLSWCHFPLEVKITSFSMMNIVILHLGDCPNLIDVQSIEGLVSLRTLKLIEIPLLERLPDLSNMKKLNELHLGHCHNLIDVQSIEGLGNLRTLKLIEIPLLKRLPDLSNLKKLIELHLWYCQGLTEIESFKGLENLMMLRLDELPLLGRLPNLSNLKKLAQLDVRRCHNLVKIQGRLESLEALCIQGCRNLEEALDPASSFKKLKSLRIHDCEKLCLDRIWFSKFEISDRAYGNSTCRLLSKIGICVCMLGRKFFLPSLP